MQHEILLSCSGNEWEAAGQARMSFGGGGNVGRWDVGVMVEGPEGRDVLVPFYIL